MLVSSIVWFEIIACARGATRSAVRARCGCVLAGCVCMCLGVSVCDCGFEWVGMCAKRLACLVLSKVRLGHL